MAQSIRLHARGVERPPRRRSPISARRVAASSARLAEVAIATLLVSGVPIALVWWLRASGVVSSVALCVVIGMALSLCASFIGCLAWEKHPRSEDLLFSELMVWGFIHRWRTERRLASAKDMVGPMSDARRRSLAGVSVKEQATLLERMVSNIETRDPYLHGHSRRVARYSWMIGTRMGLSREHLARIRTAAAIHDVGKVQTPTAILHKAGRLTDAEFEVIKQHPCDGARMAAVLHDPNVTAMVRHHHERIDGTGYPDGLTGTDIPLGARIIAVADTFDAITSSRPYRVASSHKQAIDVLKTEAGSRLDPAVVRAFCGHYAGRRPVALWASAAGLPDRLISWLGGSVAGVASAAKMAVVAALVGGTAATSMLALPLARPHVSHAPRSSSGVALARAVRASAPGSVASIGGRGSAIVGVGSHGRRRVPHTALPTVRTPRRGSRGGARSEAVMPQVGAAAGGSSGDGEAPHGRSPGNEPPAKGSGEAAPVEVKAVEPPVKVGGGTPPVTVSAGEPPGKGTVEEVKPKSEEAVSKAPETVTGKVEEVKSKVEAVKGKVGEVVGKVTGGLPIGK